MKVLLLNPPFVPEFIRSSRWAAVSVSGSNWYPIYLAYCAGNLERFGHKVKLVDAPVDKLSEEDVLGIAQAFSPDICVLYISTVSLDNDVSIGEKIKNLTGCCVVLVGPWCSINPDDIIKRSDKIDSLAIGEFDNTILEVAEEVPIDRIDGMVWRKDGKVFRNSIRKPLTSEQISELPFVTDVYRRHLHIENYYQAPHLHPFVDLFTGRGCAWGKCTFCLWPHTINKGSNYRPGDISRTIAELEFIKKQIPQVKEIFIQDDTLPSWRARELSFAIMEGDLDLTWSCYTRADSSWDLDTLRLMKRSGCRCLHVGYESFSPQILKNIRKGTSPDSMNRFTAMTDQVGLVNHADFIIGLPGETVETIKATVRWAKSLNVDSYQFTMPKPYPETPLYEQLFEEGHLKDGWANYPYLSIEDIRKWTKWALWQTNLNPKYLKRMVTKPNEWNRLMRSAMHLLPSLIKNR